MTEHNAQVEHSFIYRTIAILNEYPAEEYDVTQILTLLAGVMIYPYDEICSLIPEGVSISEACRPKELYGDPTESTKELIRRLRNSFAHFNVEFENTHGEISGLYFWNKDCAGNLEWVAYLSAASLRCLFYDVANIFLCASSKKKAGISRIEKLERKYETRLRFASIEARS